MLWFVLDCSCSCFLYLFVSVRLTCGADNTLFHYLSWDSFHGIVVCPGDEDSPSSAGVIHAEVVRTFHKTCLSMRRLFSPYYKQVSCELDICGRAYGSSFGRKVFTLATVQ